MRQGSLKGLSPEQRRDAAKHRGGAGVGFRYSPASDDKALSIALSLIAGSADAWSELKGDMSLARNVAQELRAEGELELATQVLQMPGAHDRNAAETIRGTKNETRVAERNQKMRITERKLRQIIREEYIRMQEDDDVQIPIIAPTVSSLSLDTAPVPASSTASGSPPISDPDDIQNMLLGITKKQLRSLQAPWSQVTKNNSEAHTYVTFSFTVQKDGNVKPETVKVTCNPDYKIGGVDSSGKERTFSGDIAKTIKTWRYLPIATETAFTNPRVEFKALD